MVTSDGTLSIIAGNGDVHGKAVSGRATDCPMRPTGIALDSKGNLYIADGNGFIERVTSTGVISIIGGTETTTNESNPRPGPAVNSPLAPLGLAIDADGDLYIADGNGYIEKVDPDGILSIVAGYPRPGLTVPVTWPVPNQPMLVQDVAL